MNEDLELYGRRRDGSEFAAEISLGPLETPEGLLVAAAIRDVTDRKRIRREREEQDERIRRQRDEISLRDAANQALTSFTYSVSHDLRAPLRALSGYSEILVEEYGAVLGEEGRGYAGRIQTASAKMTSLIDDLLRLSREARAELHPVSLDLGEEVALIAEELQGLEPARHVHFAIQRPVRALADPVLIRTVLQNLIDNAWKFTSNKNEATIEFGTKLTDDATICCYVRDNGAGFDSTYVDKLFTPFQRLHTTQEFPGTGIGLASVAQIVGRHGGRVWAEAALGEGATFFFTLDVESMKG